MYSGELTCRFTFIFVLAVFQETPEEASNPLDSTVCLPSALYLLHGDAVKAQYAAVSCFGEHMSDCFMQGERGIDTSELVSKPIMLVDGM